MSAHRLIASDLRHEGASGPAALPGRRPRCLLIGPYDPKCGEYTFLSPPLGVWRLVGWLQHAGMEATVFDPNCCDGPVEAALADTLASFRPDVVGVSTTGMTLNYDLALAHAVKRSCPSALLVVGGMEATFEPEQMFELGPFDLVVLGEGERPLVEVIDRWMSGRPLPGVLGTAVRGADGVVQKHHAPALDGGALTDTIMRIPYEQMPYEAYWSRLEDAYAVGTLPVKAEREARLAEVRSVRLITLNYCPMGCSFCSSTNFLHAAEGRVAKVARLSAEDCVRAIDRILATHPGTRTIIFQDDIFVFTNDDRILPLCEAIVHKKARGEWPADLGFISTNRIDAMTPERLYHMRRAGFRVLGFGVESFSVNILREFNKRLIYKHIEPNLNLTLAAGITPFLDLIMSSPRCNLGDLATNVRQANYWLGRGSEVGMYPFVIPFSGAAMAEDESLAEHVEWEDLRVAGTDVGWRRPARILPVDPEVRDIMLTIEAAALDRLSALEGHSRHLPSRVRSLVWVAAATTHLARSGQAMSELSTIERRIGDYLTAADLAAAAPTPRPMPPAEVGIAGRA